MVLPDDERERLRAEESYRRAIRVDLEQTQRTDQGGGLLATAKQAAEVAKSIALTGSGGRGARRLAGPVAGRPGEPG